MSNRATHLDTEYKTELSPRQREVLELVAGGKTYGEIAEVLGITLDGVKWHMREVLTKLGVNSREEAADWWRRERSVPRRLARAARALVPLTGLRLVLVGGAVSAVAGIAVAGTVLAWWGGAGHDAAARVAAVDGGGSATGCPTTMARLGGGAVDYQNGEYITINIGAGGFVLPPGVARPACIVEDNLQLQLEMNGKPLDIEGNGVWFHVKGDFRAPAQRQLTPAMIDFKWLNWCGAPGTVQVVLKAEHYPVEDQQAPTPNCVDKSQPSRLIVLNTEP